MHTPGPWKVVRVEHRDIIDDVSVQVHDYSISLFPYHRVYSDDRSQSALCVDQRKMADARLIAAAPELLEALNEMVDCFWGTEEDPAQGNAVEKARAAIAKATGA